MALCTQLDVEMRLQWDITAEPEAVITNLIADATGIIESELRRPVESANRTETFDGGPWSIFLTNWPVTTMTTVVEDGVTLTVNTDFKWYSTGKLIRISGGYQVWWTAQKPQSIVVTYVGGYLAGTHIMQLNHLSSICAEMVARAFRKGADNAALAAGVAGSIQSVSLADSDTVTYATSSGGSFSGGGVNQFLYLEEDERRQLALPIFHRPRFGFA